MNRILGGVVPELGAVDVRDRKGFGIERNEGYGHVLSHVQYGPNLAWRGRLALPATLRATRNDCALYALYGWFPFTGPADGKVGWVLDRLIATRGGWLSRKRHGNEQ
jgi:hypothetical protein